MGDPGKDIETAAADAGLERMLTADGPALEKALTAARRLKAELPRDFALAEEPAHVFRLAAREPRR